MSAGNTHIFGTPDIPRWHYDFLNSNREHCRVECKMSNRHTQGTATNMSLKLLTCSYSCTAPCTYYKVKVSPFPAISLLHSVLFSDDPCI